MLPFPHPDVSHLRAGKVAALVDVRLSLKDGGRCMFGRKKKKPSLLKRLMYFILLLSGGGGIGGYAFKDHPMVQALVTAVTGNPAGASPSDVEKSLVGGVADLLKQGPDFSQPGVYRVTITKVELAQGAFKPGQTVDIQAKVTRRDGRGEDSVVWDSRSYGERLAVVGKDSLTAGWPNRPFQVEWSPGEVVFLEVYDRKPHLFAPPRRFTLSSSNGSADFLLKTGDFTLAPEQRVDSSVDPRLNHIVLASELAGGLKPARQAPAQVAADSDSPIVIK